MSAGYAIAPTSTALFSAADDKYEELRTAVTSERLAGMAHDDVERYLESEGRELLRLLYQDHITLRGQEIAAEPVLCVDGVIRTHQRHDAARTIGSILGPVRLERTGYSVRGHSSSFPVDADLNLPRERHSLEVRRQAAEHVARDSFDEVTRFLHERTGATAGKRQVEELAQRAATDFDAFYGATVLDIAPEQTADILVLTFDMKGIVVREQDLRPATRKAAQRKKHKLDKRLCRGEKRNRKRMAMVASVYNVAPWNRTPDQVASGLRGIEPQDGAPGPRPKPELKRVWASLENTPQRVIDQAFAEAASRDPKRQKRWVVLVDGDPKQLRWVEDAARFFKREVTIILDVIHVLEYLWKAAHIFCEDGTKDAEAWVAERFLKVLQGRAGLVAGGIRRSATMRRITGKKRERLDTTANYLKKYAKYLRYDEYLADGLPIATGVIEGACRSLIADRMDITGARWSLRGAEAVLRLRALRASGDFDTYWEFHREEEYRRSHGSAYPTGRHPKLARPTHHGHLRVVK